MSFICTVLFVLHSDHFPASPLSLGVPPLNSSASVTVTVENVDDVATRFVGLPSGCLEVKENQAIGAEVLRLSVEDADSKFFNYRIHTLQDRSK